MFLFTDISTGLLSTDLTDLHFANINHKLNITYIMICIYSVMTCIYMYMYILLRSCCNCTSYMYFVYYLLRIEALDRSKNNSEPPQNANRMRRIAMINPRIPPTMLVLFIILSGGSVEVLLATVTLT